MWDEDHYGAENEHRTLKTALRVGLTSVLVAIAILLVAPNLIDWNRYKPEVEARLQNATGRPIKINGDLDFTLLWTPALMASDVQVANVKGSQSPDLLRLKRLDVRVDVLPLLSGKLHVSSLKLVEPMLAVERLTDGRSNLDRPAEAPPPAASGAAKVGWFHLDRDSVSVDHVVIEHGTLAYRDVGGQWGETLTGIAADFSLPTLEGPYDVKGAFEWKKHRYDVAVREALPQKEQQRALELKIAQSETRSTLSLVGRVTPGTNGQVISGALTLRAAEPEKLLDAAHSGQETAFALDGVLSTEGAKASLSELVVQWGEFSATGRATAEFDGPWSATIALKGHQLNVDSLLPVPSKDASAFWPASMITDSAVAQAEAKSDFLNAGRIELDLALDGAFLHKGLIENIRAKGAYTKGSFAIDQATGLLPGKTEAEIRGKVTPVSSGVLFDGDVALAGPQARDFCAWLGMAVDGVPATRLKSFAYKGGLSVGGGKATFRGFEAALDGGHAVGRLTVQPGTRTRIDGDITVTRLNLDPYTPIWRSAPVEGEASSGVKDDFAFAPIFAEVDRVDGALKLQVDSLTWRQVRMNGLAADLAHEGDTLTVRSLTIGDMDGARLTLTGDGKKLGEAATLSANVKLQGNDMTPALVLAGVLPDTTRAVLGPGHLDVSATLSNGSGSVSAEGQLDTAQLAYRAELSNGERPLLGVLGAGHLKSDLRLTAPNAADLAHPFGFAAAKTAPKSPQPGTLVLTTLVSPEASDRALDVRAGDATATGRLVRSAQGGGAVYDGELSVKVPDLARLIATLGAETPEGLKAGEALAVQVTAKGPEAGLVIAPASMSLGSDMLSAEGGLDLSGALPRLDLGVKAGTLDLDRLGALWRVWNGRSALAGWSDSPLPFDWMGKLNGTLNAEAQRVHLFGLDFETPHFSAKLADGTMQFTDGRATLFGGPMTANWALRGGGTAPGFAMSLKFIDANGKAASQALWGAPVLNGPLDGAFTLQAAGASERALAATLNGDVTLRARNGTLRGFDLAGFETARGNLISGDNPDRALQRLADGETRFQTIDVKASVEGGVARLTEAAVAFDVGDGPLAGSIDAVNQTLAVSLDLPAKDLPIDATLTLNGPLAAPKRLLDTKALRAALAKESSRRAEKLPPQPVSQVDQAPLPAPSGAPKALHKATP